MDHALTAFRAPALGTFLLRVALGVMWLTHSIVLKLMTFGMANLAAWMDSQAMSFVHFLLGDGPIALTRERVEGLVR
jgi:hypothetical protein